MGAWFCGFLVVVGLFCGGVFEVCFLLLGGFFFTLGRKFSYNVCSSKA